MPTSWNFNWKAYIHLAYTQRYFSYRDAMYLTVDFICIDMVELWGTWSKRKLIVHSGIRSRYSRLLDRCIIQVVGKKVKVNGCG